MDDETFSWMTNLSAKEEGHRRMKHDMYLNYNLESMQQLTDEIRKFEVRDSDIFLVGYPKSGTTWATEMVWLIGNDLNFDAAQVCLDDRFPLLEYSGYDITLCNSNFKVSECHINSIKYTDNLKSPRFIKTHFSGKNLPEQLLSGQKKPKIIYIARNVKDVCLSAFHYQTKLLNGGSSSLIDYCNSFINKGIFAVGNYWENVLYFWDRRNEDHILFIKYEEMINNLPVVLQKVAKHLGTTLTKDQEIQLSKWLDFESIKNNSAVNCNDFYNRSGFIRVGKSGEHKKEMPPELITKFDIWTKECLKNSDYVL